MGGDRVHHSVNLRTGGLELQNDPGHHRAPRVWERIAHLAEHDT